MARPESSDVSGAGACGGSGFGELQLLPDVFSTFELSGVRRTFRFTRLTLRRTFRFTRLTLRRTFRFAPFS